MSKRKHWHGKRPENGSTLVLHAIDPASDVEELASMLRELADGVWNDRKSNEDVVYKALGLTLARIARQLEIIAKVINPAAIGLTVIG